jgi:hypothetical protein
MLARVLAVFCVALRTGTGLALAVGAPSLRLLEWLSVESRVPQAAAPPRAIGSTCRCARFSSESAPAVAFRAVGTFPFTS